MEEPVSRRRLMKLLGGAAALGAAAAVGGADAQRADAADNQGPYVDLGQPNDGQASNTDIYSTSSTGTLRVFQNGFGGSALVVQNLGNGDPAIEVVARDAGLEITGGGSALIRDATTVGLQANAVSAGTGVIASSDSGVGLYANAGTGGVGLVSQAPVPLRLVAATTAGAPTTGQHVVGDVYVDSSGALFVCTTAGTPGSWSQVAYAGNAAGAGAGFHALNPTRVCDTRANAGPTGSQPNPLNVYSGQTLHAFSDLTVLVGGPIGPAGAQQTLVPATATAVVLNVTVVNFTAPGNFTVYPADLSSPPTSANLNWPGPQSDGLSAIGNSVTVKIGNPSGDSAHRGVKIHNASAGTTDVVVDLAGYYA